MPRKYMCDCGQFAFFIEHYGEYVLQSGNISLQSAKIKCVHCLKRKKVKINVSGK